MTNVHLLGAEDRPAPGGLRFVQGLLNTLDVDKGADALADTAGVELWLLTFGLVSPGTRITDEDAAAFRSFREAVRALLASHDGEPDDGALRTLGTLTATVALGISFDPTGAVRLHSRSAGLDGAIGELLVAIQAASADGSLQRLKVCGRDSCRWAFFDSSKNRSSNWCSMQTCGNREKVARHRHKAAAPAVTD